MARHAPAHVAVFFGLTAMFIDAMPLWAQSTGPDSQPQAPVNTAAAASNDSRRRLVEPDYRVINLPTTARLPLHRSNFQLTHRFAGNLRRGSFGYQASNLFGVDQGAMVGLEYRFAVAKDVQAAVYRATLDKTFQFHGKYDALRQSDSTPLSMSAVLSIEGADNFKQRRAPAIGAVVSLALAEKVTAYAVPMWVHNTAALLGVNRDTFYVGLGVRVRLRSSVYLVGEVSPRLAGYAPSQPELGFGVEKRLGGHIFQLNFTNTSATTFGQTARGGFPESLYLGFNLARKF